MKYIIILFCLIFIPPSLQAQVTGYKGSRLFINANVGISPGSMEFGTGSIVKPRTQEVSINKQLPVVTPTIEVGLNYVVSNNIIIKLQYGLSRKISPVFELHPYSGNSNQYSTYKIYNPFTLNEFTFGYRFNTKKYIAPISHMFAELELITSLYDLNSGYVYTQSPLIFETLAIGFYKNFCFGKGDYLSGFFGFRFGVPIYFNISDAKNIQSNIGDNAIDAKETYTHLQNNHILNKAVQTKIGLQFVIPYKTVKK